MTPEYSTVSECFVFMKGWNIEKIQYLVALKLDTSATRVPYNGTI
jgi:hypothetical protein